MCGKTYNAARYIDGTLDVSWFGYDDQVCDGQAGRTKIVVMGVEAKDMDSSGRSEEKE